MRAGTVLLAAALAASQLPRAALDELPSEAVARQIEAALEQLLRSAQAPPDLRRLREGYRVVRHASFCVTRLDLLPPENRLARATVDWEIAGEPAAGGLRQDQGAWQTAWRRTDEAWQLSSIQPIRAFLQESPVSLFRDWTAQALGVEPSFALHLARGLEHWSGVLDAASQIDYYGLNGIAAGDFDGDGWDDLYVCQPGGLPNRLLRNRGDGVFHDVTERAGLAVLDPTSSALWADFDNDGDQDLFVITVHDVLLFLNNGQGRFQRSSSARFEVPSEQRGLMMMGALADYDRDGFLDLYVCQYSPARGRAMANPLHQPVPYHDAMNGAPNFLFRNNGDGTFGNVTEKAGLGDNNRRWSFAAAWGDYDADGHPDLYVANDFGPNNLYRNRGDGTFLDVASQAGVEDVGAGMSVAWEDYDNDGRLDLYISNIWSAAGRRITSLPEFHPSTGELTRQLLRRFSQGNTLFRNRGDGTFHEVSAGAENGGWAWGSGFLDFDNDGHEDLVVLNGQVTNDETADLESFHWTGIVAFSPLSPSRSKRYEDGWRRFAAAVTESGLSLHGRERNRALRNTGAGGFVDISGISGLDFPDDGRAFASLDLDGDGDLDLAFKNRTSPQLRILRNEAGQAAPAIAFHLVGSRSNRDAVGARIIIHTASGARLKQVSSGGGFLSQHTRRVHFGLGRETRVALARIVWPSGTVQELRDIPAGSLIRVEEGNDRFHSLPFRPSSVVAAQPPSTVRLPDPDPEGVWLLDPMPLPRRLRTASPDSAVSLDALRGAPVVLNVSAPDCPACAQERPEWEALAGAGNPPRVVRLTLAQAPAETATLLNAVLKRLFVRERDLQPPFSLLLDSEGHLAKIYRGPVRASWLRRDAALLSQATLDRVALALPFRGQYYAPSYSRLDAYFRIANDCLKSGLYEEALEYFRECLRLDASLGEVWNNIGLVAARKGDHAEALGSFEKAAALDPNSAQVRFNIGTSLAMQRRLSEAVRALEQAAVMDPDDPGTWSNLGNAWLDDGQPEKARGPLERALRLDPASPPLRNSLGTLYAELGQPDRALAEFEQAVLLDPNYEAAWRNLGLMHLRRQNLEKARAMFRRVLELNPRDPEARRLAGESP